MTLFKDVLRTGANLIVIVTEPKKTIFYMGTRIDKILTVSVTFFTTHLFHHFSINCHQCMSQCYS